MRYLGKSWEISTREVIYSAEKQFFALEAEVASRARVFQDEKFASCFSNEGVKFLVTVSTWKMAPRHWTAAPAVVEALHRARGSFFRHCPRGGRASFIEATAISRCRRNRCLETAPSPARGEQPFFSIDPYLPLSPPSPRRYKSIIAKLIGLLRE